MGCTLSRNSSQQLRSSAHNSVVPSKSMSYIQLLFFLCNGFVAVPLDPWNLLDSTIASLGEPPPYTQLPENGHVSLMHGSPLKPDEHASTTASVYLNSTNRHFLSSSFNSTDNVLSESTEAFHPTRTSSPLTAVATAPPEELFTPYLESTLVPEPFPPHLPPLNRLMSYQEQPPADNEQTNNIASSAEHRHKRRRRKRRRGHSWHGERVAPAPMQHPACDHH